MVEHSPEEGRVTSSILVLGTTYMVAIENYKISIENPKGSYKSFESDDSTENSYPLKGVTYPVDYGYIEGYVGEDGADLDIFVGTGDKAGYIKVWRLDVPEETKFFINLTEEELSSVISAFKLVLLNYKVLDAEIFDLEIGKFSKK